MLDRWAPYALAVLRIATAYLYIWHGSAKLFGWPHQAAFDNFQIFSLMGLAGVLEFFGGLLLLVGLLTRPVAFILAGEMAVGYFMAHASQGHALLPLLNRGDLAVLFCFVFLYLVFAGPGAFSVDAMMRETSGWAWLKSQRYAGQR